MVSMGARDLGRRVRSERVRERRRTVPDLIFEAPLVSPDEARLRERGARLERLLDELHGSVGPSAWPSVEALVTTLVELYEGGITRLVAHARAAAVDRDALDARLTGDEWVAGLLALHGLHPVPLEVRVTRALDEVHHAALTADCRFELVAIGRAAITLRLTHEAGASASIARSLAAVAARAVEQVAPEVAAVDVQGLPATPPAATSFVSVERLVSGGRR